MEGFNETDAENLQRVKDAMAERAVGGGVLAGPDAAAAAAFAALLDAETRRAELAPKSQGQGRPRLLRLAGGSWAESVTGGQVEPKRWPGSRLKLWAVLSWLRAHGGDDDGFDHGMPARRRVVKVAVPLADDRAFEGNNGMYHGASRWPLTSTRMEG